MDVVTLAAARAAADRRYPRAVPAWFGIGDSIMRGAGSSDQFTGFFELACIAQTFGFMYCPFFGEQAANFANQRHTRMAGMRYTTHTLDEYDINDLKVSLGNKSAATVEANDLLRWQAAYNRGQVVYATTSTPAPLSTSGAWGSVADQTPDANDAARTARNDWLRDGAPCTLTTSYPTPAATGASGGGVIRMGQTGHPLSGYFDMADVVESSRNSGKLKAAARFVTDASMISGSATVVSATAAFVSGDVGTLVNVGAAGAAGAILSVKVSSVASPSTATAWTATTAKTIGVVARPTVANGNLYQVTTAGTTGSAEPTWPTSTGTVTDGSVVWTYLGAATAGVLSNPAGTSVTNTGLAFDPWTVDGVHPSPKGHTAMAAALDLTTAVKANPPRVFREWVPIAYRVSGNNNGFTSGKMGGTCRIGHPLVPGRGYSQLKVVYGNFVGNFSGSDTFTMRAAAEWEGKVHAFTFAGSLSGNLLPGQPLLESDPLSLDVAAVASTNFFTRTYFLGGSSAVQAPQGLSMITSTDGHNYSSTGGADLTGGGWYQTPASPPSAGTGGAFAPMAVLGRVSSP